MFSSKQNFQRKRKRGFTGNQHTKLNFMCNENPTDNEPGPSVNTCLRSKKIRLSDAAQRMKTPENDYHIIINFEILQDFVSSIASCPDCDSKKLEFSNNYISKMGLAMKFELKCKSCSWKKEFYTSKECKNKQKQGRNIFEVNVRSVMAFREMGKGHEAMSNYFRVMNMDTLSEPCYRNINNHLFIAYESAAKESTERASKETVQQAIAKGNVHELMPTRH